MKLLAGLALASMAVAAPLVEKRAPTPLNVSLEMQGNSKIKAVITNNGKSNLKLLKSGTFLDSTAVEKAQVYSGGKIFALPNVGGETMPTHGVQECTLP